MRCGEHSHVYVGNFAHQFVSVRFPLRISLDGLADQDTAIARTRRLVSLLKSAHCSNHICSYGCITFPGLTRSTSGMRILTPSLLPSRASTIL